MKFLRYLNRRLALYCQNGNTLLVQVSLSSSYVHIRVSLVFKKNIKFCSDMFTPGGMDSQPHFLGIWIGYIQYIVHQVLHRPQNKEKPMQNNFDSPVLGGFFCKFSNQDFLLFHNGIITLHCLGR